MSSFFKTLLLSACWMFVGCPSQKADPPPPPSKPEIPPAPPAALGALAAGTDAAPGPELGEALEPVVPPLGGRDAGAVPNDGGLLAPAAPDSGMAL